MLLNWSDRRWTGWVLQSRTGRTQNSSYEISIESTESRRIISSISSLLAVARLRALSLPDFPRSPGFLNPLLSSVSNPPMTIHGWQAVDKSTSRPVDWYRDMSGAIFYDAKLWNSFHSRFERRAHLVRSPDREFHRPGNARSSRGKPARAFAAWNSGARVYASNCNVDADVSFTAKEKLLERCISYYTGMASYRSVRTLAFYNVSVNAVPTGLLCNSLRAKAKRSPIRREDADRGADRAISRDIR